MAMTQRDSQGRDRPDPHAIDERVQWGASRITWIAAVLVLVVVGALAMFSTSGSRNTGAPTTTAGQPTQPQRTVPPSGQTGEVPGSRSPVQR